MREYVFILDRGFNISTLERCYSKLTETYHESARDQYTTANLWTVRAPTVLRFKPGIIERTMSEYKTSVRIILSHAEMIENYYKIANIIEERKGKDFSFATLSPMMLFSHEHPHTTELLKLLAKNYITATTRETHYKNQRPPLKAEIIELLTDAKRAGKQIKEIAKDFAVSPSTVWRYTRDIRSDIIRDVPIKVSLKTYPVFNGALMDRLVIDRPSKLFDITANIIILPLSDNKKRFNYIQIKQFFDYVNKELKYRSALDAVASFKKHEVEEYIFYMRKTLCDTSIHMRLFLLSKLWARYVENSICDDNPFFETYREFPVHKDASIKTLPITPDEIKGFFKVARDFVEKSRTSHQLYSRTRNLMATFLYSETGARISSVLNLKISDIFYDESMVSLRLLRKGGGTYEVKLSPKASQALASYIKSYFSAVSADSFIFARDPQNPTCPIMANKYNKYFKKMVKMARIERKISPHSFRVGLAVAWHKAGVDTVTIQKRLCHNDLNQTGRYIKLDPEPIINDRGAEFYNDLSNTLSENMKRLRKI